MRPSSSVWDSKTGDGEKVDGEVRESLTRTERAGMPLVVSRMWQVMRSFWSDILTGGKGACECAGCDFGGEGDLHVDESHRWCGLIG